MDCERVGNLISAHVDGELAPAEGPSLDAHLAGCAACRAVLEAVELDDAALVRAFAARREAAAGLALRIAFACSGSDRASASGTLPMAGLRSGSGDVAPGGRTTHRGWRGQGRLAGAAAAAAIGLLLLLRHGVPPGRPSPAPPAAPVAQLVFASGDVFTCPGEGQPWRPAAPGAAFELGTAVRTSDAGKCELALPGGSKVRLNADTELRLAAAREVELAGGQIWSAAPPDAEPLRITAGHATVTTVGPAARLDVSCAGAATTVTVMAGSARVAGQGRAATVAGGESLQVGPSAGADPATAALACTPVRDPVATVRWQDDLLLHLPAGDPELTARVDALLGRIAAERGGRDEPASLGRAGVAPEPAGGPGATERDVRARGHAWAAPFARYAIAHPSPTSDGERDKCRTAARLLADLAPPERVGDLIALLGAEDGEVRRFAAAGLHRLTGQTLGFTPDQCAASPPAAGPSAAWQAWWARNRPSYTGRNR